MSDKQIKTLEDFHYEVVEECKDDFDAESLTPDEKVIIGMQIDQEAKDRFHAYQLQCKDKEIEERDNYIHLANGKILEQSKEVEKFKKEIKRLTEKCSSEYWRGWNSYGESL